ncbi:catechol 2,3-dioxygenase [Bacillus benzoevorans]|uniref:Metapyrocatechase n=1 Tax=Bacillus benzoevorans TaxID=1456 RepID=A0A7X0LV49_9BACI|nr:catechol 2,3-dioxygenase [Bacillus benzoevorans]MBB6445243.1 catechol 2,3-dioxygenase [Bacillus benzoevorans]
MNGNGIERVGRIQLRVHDFEQSVDYYSNILGLDVTGQDDNRVYLKAWDEWDHHSVILEKSDYSGMDHIAFKVTNHDVLDKLERKIEQFGCDVKRVSNQSRLGEGEAIRFILPTGHTFELYHEIDYVGVPTGRLNPHPWPDGLRGIAPHRLDHALLAGDDVDTTMRLFTEILGFVQTERVVSVDSEQLIASFLSTSMTGHDIAFIKGPNAKLHHVGFYLGNWYEVLKAADILARNGIEIEVTPTRHGITRGETIYFFDPSGNRNEVCTGGYAVYSDFPTITWTEDKLGQGIFYHRRQLNETFSSVFS